MTMTRDQQLQQLMRLPWTVTTECNEEEGYLVARVAELPDAIATGQDAVVLAKELWHSLWSSLSARLEFGDEIPLPAGRRLPWEGPQAIRASVQVLVSKTSEAWEAVGVATGAVVRV